MSYDKVKGYGKAAGSWEPTGEWAPVAGRVYQTALCTLMLEVYYRYLPLYLREPPAMQAGQVTPAAQGAKAASAVKTAP